MISCWDDDDDEETYDRLLNAQTGAEGCVIIIIRRKWCINLEIKLSVLFTEKFKY